MFSKKNIKTLFALILTFAILLTSIPTVFVSAQGTVEFDFGGLEEGFPNAKFYLDSGTVTMPKRVATATHVDGGTWSQNKGEVHVSGWLWNETGKYYEAGTVVNNVPAGATFSAVYGNNYMDFNDLPTNLKIYDSSSNNVSYGSQKTSIEVLEDGNNAIKFTGASGDSNSFQKFTALNKDGSYYRMIGYNKGAQYKVTFKYKRTDTSSADSDLCVAFGSVTVGGWRSNTAVKQSIKVATTKKGMTEFETVTAYVTAPNSYTQASGTTSYYSRAVAFGVYLSEGVEVIIDDFSIESTLGKTHATVSYGNDDSSTALFEDDTILFADKDGNITLPTNDSAINLLWKNGDKYYAPGSKVNEADFVNGSTFEAIFAGASVNFENIQTSNIKWTTQGGEKSNNLFGELSRSASYWRVPEGLTNVPVSNGYYGLALGNTVMGITGGSGKSGKGLQLTTGKNYSNQEYRNAVLFSHDPTSFDKNTKIQYSYVYFTPNTEYTMEFDYKTTSEIDVTIAFGVSFASGNGNCGTKSVNSANFGAEGTYVTLEASGGEWKHASVTVTAPSSYTGNNITSARVGIAVKDNETTDANTTRPSYFDNILFYPTSTGKMEFDYGGLDEGFRNAKFYQDYTTLTMPTNKTSTGVLVDGGTWTVSRGDVSVSGWLCNETGKYYGAGEIANGIPANATFSAVYGNNSVDFNDLPTDMTIYDNANNKVSYGSPRVNIESIEGNNYIKFTGTEADSAAIHQFAPIFKNGSYYRMIGYNRGAKYKVTFKYRRTDNTDADSDLYISFGAMTIDWRTSERSIQKSKVATTNKNMTEFETVTAFVTAPETYSGATVVDCKNYYSKVISIAASLSNGVVIEIDDFSIETTTGSSYVIFDKNIGANDCTNDIVLNGKSMTELPEVAHEGFEFCGWYDNRLGNGEPVSVIVGDGEIKKYYAKWVPVLSGETAAISINNNDLSSYQLVLPKNKTLVLSDALSDFETFMLSKGATIEEQANQIIIEDTSSKVISNEGSSYTIEVENNNLLISATDDAAMVGALDRLSQFIETAYEKNKTLNFASDFNFTQAFIADDSQYSYSWSDEFSSDVLNKSIWLNRAGYSSPSVKGYQIGTGIFKETNKESGFYSINSQGIFVDNGSAVIRTEKVNAKDGAGNDHYFIGRGMSTIGSVQYLYGCIEIKAKLPKHPAAPSIWLYSSQDVKTTAEIDLHEGIGKVSGYENNQQIVSNLHASYHLSADENKWKTALDNSQALDSADSQRIYLGNAKTNYDDEYHIYSVKWTPDEVVFALDGEVYYTYNFNTDTDLINNATTYDGTSPFAGLTSQQIKDCFSKQMYINFGNSMGTLASAYGPVYENGDPEQADLLIDYVRVYQSADNEGSTFTNKPYTQDEIAEVEAAEKAFIVEKGIEDRGETTKTVVMSGEGIETEAIKINVGDTLPVNCVIGSKYIYGWTDGTENVKTYKDPSKTYTPQFIDLNMLDITYKVSDAGNGNSNLLFASTVDSNWADYSKAGFVYSENQATPTIGASDCISVETKKVYEDGLISGSDLLNSEAAGYTAYSKYMFNLALKDIALSGREKDINVRSYVVLSDGRVVYGNVLTISAEEVLKVDVESEFDNFIIERLATGATLDNLVDYNDDNKVDIFDLIRAKKISLDPTLSDEAVNAITITSIRKILLFYNASKVK